MIQTLGSDQYALYTLAMSVVTLFLVDFGIGSSVSKFLANYYAKGQQEEANRFLGTVYRIFFVISALVAVGLGIYYGFIGSVYQKLTAEELQTFKRLFLIVGAYSVISFPCTTFNGILMAGEQFIAVKACNFGQKLLSVVIIVAALLLGGNVYSLVLAHTASHVLFFGVKYRIIRKRTNARACFSGYNREMTKQLLGFSIWITVISLAQRCIFNIMPTVIAAVVGSAAVTLFSLSATLEGYVYTLADAVNGMFLPRISRIIVKENANEELSSLMCNVGRYHVYTIGLLFIGFLCVGRHFVRLWMGDGYEAVYVCAILLIIPSMVDVPQQIAKTALLASDLVKQQAWIYMGMAVLNLGLSIPLLSVFGVPGAAVSICISYLFRTGALNYLYWKYLHVDIAEYFKRTYSRWLLVAAITTAAGLILDQVLQMQGWIGLAIKCLCTAAIYGVVLLTLGIDKSERTKLVCFIKRRK